MAFSQATLFQTAFGNKKVVHGSYDGSGVTTGELSTGLNNVEGVVLTPNGASIVADAPTVNEAFPLAGSAVTLIFTSGTKGYWTAFGN
jgi:hypothetical protein